MTLPKNACLIAGCTDRHFAFGLCWQHFTAWWQNRSTA